MSVRAAFRCQSITRRTESEGWDIEFVAVADKDGAYKEFFKYTPNGQLRMGCLNPSAVEQFVPGKVYFLDFSPAE